MANTRFAVRFPCVTLPENLGGRRALVFMSAKPKGADEKLVLATCMDVLGRMHGNVPFSMDAIRYAAETAAVTLIEVVGEGGAQVPMGGLVGMDGRPLKS